MMKTMYPPGPSRQRQRAHSQAVQRYMKKRKRGGTKATFKKVPSPNPGDRIVADGGRGGTITPEMRQKKAVFQDIRRRRRSRVG